MLKANKLSPMLANPALKTASSPLACLEQPLRDAPDLAFAVLVGSRADGTGREDSDWDIAVFWKAGQRVEPANAANPAPDNARSSLANLGRHETLRRHLALALNRPESAVDLIDLRNTGLTMKALVVEEGKVLLVNDELAWAQFQTRTWRELEDYYWDRAHAH